jgi:hypothetical protein
MVTTTQQARSLPVSLGWLADAPLFIDADQIDRFYDAVARPQNKQGTMTLQVTQENSRTIEGKLNLEGGLTTEKLAAALTPIFAFLRPSVKVAGEGSLEHERKKGEGISLDLLPISTPQRQLEMLTLHYIFNHPRRIFFIDDVRNTDWYEPATITSVPREVVFLQLPSSEEAETSDLPQTKLIPTAAEFESGKTVLIYKRLEFSSEPIPEYPERASTLQELKNKRKEYWQWFDQNYSATKAMVAVEEAASENGRIRWIDYRLPISKSGSTLHLHVCPNARYDTGVVAYNFIKRGSKHGLRIIGTLKSGPDLNVLSIYDR